MAVVPRGLTRPGDAPVGQSAYSVTVMSALETILVAFDDPESKTLSHAADLAEALQAALIVTNVAPSEHEEKTEEGREYGLDRLDQARAYLAERGLEADLVQSVGQPAEAIVSLAEERNVDLIVVGMRKKRFFERLVEGSVAQDVMRRATCDVLAVH
jgi:nucleotide-binding universal stress UspA family protein